jgi:hypothetical protein
MHSLRNNKETLTLLSHLVTSTSAKPEKEWQKGEIMVNIRILLGDAQKGAKIFKVQILTFYHIMLTYDCNFML